MEIPLGQAKVIKKLITLQSGNKAEAIYFDRPEKQVICISTQISCNVNCIFCASPGKGKTYNLTADEMIEQIEAMSIYRHSDSILLVSFMGEGEPFANYKETIKAMHYVDNTYTFCKLSISTIGLNLDKYNEMGNAVGNGERIGSAPIEVRFTCNKTRDAGTPANENSAAVNLTFFIEHRRSLIINKMGATVSDQ